MMITCPVCGKEVVREYNIQIYCCEKCRRKAQRRNEAEQYKATVEYRRPEKKKELNLDTVWEECKRIAKSTGQDPHMVYRQKKIAWAMEHTEPIILETR